MLPYYCICTLDLHRRFLPHTADGQLAASSRTRESSLVPLSHHSKTVVCILNQRLGDDE